MITVSYSRDVNSRIKTKDCIALGILGIVVAAGGGFLPIRFGEMMISNDDLWRLGLAQLYVFFGLALSLLSLLLYRGVLVVRWLIVFWCPMFIITTGLWAIHLGIEISAFDLLELPVILGIWIYGTWKMKFER